MNFSISSALFNYLWSIQKVPVYLNRDTGEFPTLMGVSPNAFIINSVNYLQTELHEDK